METYSSDSAGFVNLLNSQTSDLESSEVPRFSTQCSAESSAKAERRKWVSKEDVILIGAWLNTSKDPIIGNEQKAGAFWRRIQDYYNSNPTLSGKQPRTGAQCKQRWQRINDHVCKFVGAYDIALKIQSSGQNDNDVMKSALEIFNSDNGAKFTLEHAWRELRHDQKWCSTYLSKDGVKEKRKHVVDCELQEDEQERPIGVKAAKLIGKRKKTAKEESASQLQAMLETKEKIAKHKLLGQLLAKIDPLSEIELALKLKLITELL